MKIIHVADIQVGATSVSLLTAAADAIASQHADALAVSGDLTQRGTHAEFAEARAWVDTLRLPTITVPGNHDTPLLDARHRVFQPFARYTAYFGDLTQTLAGPGARLYPLNTARGWQTRANWAEGAVDLAQLAALIGSIAGGDDVAILVCHHPFKAFAGAGLVTRTHRGTGASAKIGASAIRLVLTGHVHTPHAARIETPDGNYLAVSAGTLSHRVRRSPPGFNVIEVDAEGARVTPHALNGAAFEPLATQRFDWPDLRLSSGAG